MLPLSERLCLATQVMHAIWVDGVEANPDGSASMRPFRFSKPSDGLYSSGWAWDSAWHILGNAYLNPQRAQWELQSLFARQWDNGMLPMIMYGSDPHKIYYPGPAEWGNGHSTASITQVPVWTWLITRALEVVEAKHPNQANAFAKEVQSLLPNIERSHLFYHQRRDPLDIGAVSSAHPWENGTDNTPANMVVMDSIVPTEAAKEHGRKKAEISNVTASGERPDETYYAKVFTISEGVEHVDNDNPGLFNIYDPLMTMALCLSEQALITLAQRWGDSEMAQRAAKRLERLQAGLETLWHPTQHSYSYVDALQVKAGASFDEARIESDTICCYLPIAVLVQSLASCTEDVRKQHTITRIEQIITSLKRRGYVGGNTAGLPTASPTHENRYDPSCYWLGPIWVNLSYLMDDALRQVAVIPEIQSLIDGVSLPMDAVHQLVAQSGECREYYHAETGKGLGANGFGWTAACLLDHSFRHGLVDGATLAQQLDTLIATNRQLYDACCEYGWLDNRRSDALLSSIATDGQQVRMAIRPDITDIMQHDVLTELFGQDNTAQILQIRPGKLHILVSDQLKTIFAKTC